MSTLTTDDLVDINLAIDTLWVTMATILVFFMQAGFALLEVGSVRAKNAQNILLKNIIDITIATLTWWLVGYGIAFGGSGNDFIGTSRYGGYKLGTDTEYRDWLFQWAFAGTTSTIVSGALAERTNVLAYCIVSFLLTLFIYPMIVHWIWGGGWLGNWGFLDFAGSCVIHLTGGTASLIGAYIVGPRIGRFDEKYQKSFRPHNVPLLVTGVFILWFGWYGFNCGSTLGITGDNLKLVSKIGINTSIAGASGGLFGLFVDILMQQIRGTIKSSHLILNVVGPLTNGILAGLVAITAGCDSVTQGVAFFIGGVGGVICYFCSIFLQKLQIDDPLDAVSVHGSNGLWGTIAVGLFHTTKGLFYSGKVDLLGKQVVGGVTIIVWCGILSIITFWSLNKFKMLRVDATIERMGLDAYEHGGSGYFLTGDNSRRSSKESARVHNESIEEEKYKLNTKTKVISEMIELQSEL